MRTIPPVLRDLAGAQQGAFASHQARPLGLEALELSRLAAAGMIRRVRRGAYVIDDLLDSDRPEDRYASEVRAVLLSRGRRTWASHHAALALSGLTLVECDLTRFDVCSPVDRTFTRSGLTTHPLSPGDESLVVGGARSVSLPLALSQVQARSLRTAVVASDAALREGLVDVRDIERAPGGGRLASHVDSAAESPGESLTRLLLRSLGWSVRSQVRIPDGSGLIGRVDFVVGERVVVEFDGLIKYEGEGGWAALAREKAREDRLRAAGYQVVRRVWSDLRDPHRVAQLVRQAAHRAGQGAMPR
jgi:very-short-patch-repair endonuclease